MLEREGSDWLSLDTHMYRLDPPDLFHLKTIGPFTRAHGLRVFDLMRERHAATGHKVYWLLDIARMGTFDSDARKVTTSIDSSQFVAWAIIYGGSFHVRVVATMATRAAYLIRPDKRVPTYFVTNEAEGRAHIEALRCGKKP